MKSVIIICQRLHVLLLFWIDMLCSVEDYGKLNAQGMKNQTSDKPQTSCLCFYLWFRNHRQVVCGLSDILSDILSVVQTSDKTSDNVEKLKRMTNQQSKATINLGLIFI